MWGPPERNWTAFCLDGLKQGLGHLLIHAINLRNSTKTVDPSEPSRDECSLYLAVYVLDIGLGLPLLCLLSCAVERLTQGLGFERLSNGNYSRFRQNRLVFDLPGYCGQLLIWLGLELLVKNLLLRMNAPVVLPLSALLQKMMVGLAPRHQHREIISLVLVPLVLNLVSTWVIDSLLGKSADSGTNVYYVEEFLNADLLGASINSTLRSVHGAYLSKHSQTRRD